MENVLLNKKVTLQGAGNGNNPAVDTIVQAASNNVDVIRIRASGILLNGLWSRSCV